MSNSPTSTAHHAIYNQGNGEQAMTSTTTPHIILYTPLTPDYAGTLRHTCPECRRPAAIHDITNATVGSHPSERRTYLYCAWVDCGWTIERRQGANPDAILTSIRDAIHHCFEDGHTPTTDEIAEIFENFNALDHHLTNGGDNPTDWPALPKEQ